MTELPTRRRPDRCISDLRFDEWFAGELPAEDASELERHLASCARCAERRRELEGERTAFLREAPALAEAPRPVRARTTRRWLAPVTASLALAAAVLLAVLPRTEEPLTRTKGAERIGFYVKRGDHVSRGAPGERVRPSDQLRFTYTSARARHLAILSVDSTKRASVYYPEGPRAVSVPAGQDALLPSAVELDDTLGEERIVGLFCDTAIELAPVVAELARAAGPFSAPAGCVSHELTIVKEARSP